MCIFIVSSINKTKQKTKCGNVASMKKVVQPVNLVERKYFRKSRIYFFDFCTSDYYLEIKHILVEVNLQKIFSTRQMEYFINIMVTTYIDLNWFLQKIFSFELSKSLLILTNFVLFWTGCIA